MGLLPAGAEALWGALLLIAGAVLLCEALRRVSRAWLRGLPQELALEAVSTAQLCLCVRELALLGAAGALEPWQGLCLTYLQTVLHCLTAGADCNPCASLLQWLRGEALARDTLLRVAAQVSGAKVAKLTSPLLWGLRLSPLHAGQGPCRSPLTVGPLAGFGVEMLCALCLYILLRQLGRVREAYRVHAVALLITGLVCAGGGLTGAVFNPALAYSVLFHCDGSSFLRNVSVYWLGPVVGLLLSILLTDGCVPKFRRNLKADGKKSQ
ncbi:aquaporin-11 [Spea bombifrons]|uniref:aquaporin-11 n=1 Tax=Spea bombifrons TaxID=233779 RepID=UPI00234B1F8B|nr:aquaporin-11 [Spea bombifrons]